MATSKTRSEQPEGDQPQDETTAQVQKAVDRETDRGFHGVEVDPTPNAAYTVTGVIRGEPTPETDPVAAARARAASRGESDPVVT